MPEMLPSGDRIVRYRECPNCGHVAPEAVVRRRGGPRCPRCDRSGLGRRVTAVVPAGRAPVPAGVEFKSGGGAA